ncbi:hypothetical protein [Kosakonia oryziphila]|jgi:hypothetical protein|uniref:Uncharacterized protein n=1 Tax=Kosakonia oryziphila TaxID=1005667 RepID=A0A1C4C0K5_9ENTR|nr:hypothetical protein [Kosakonia oryziphila]SCC12686.1 hypothetical protein GA0061070_1009100 [Kosakonia oryziphila]
MNAKVSFKIMLAAAGAIDGACPIELLPLRYFLLKVNGHLRLYLPGDGAI